MRCLCRYCAAFWSFVLFFLILYYWKVLFSLLIISINPNSYQYVNHSENFTDLSWQRDCVIHQTYKNQSSLGLLWAVGQSSIKTKHLNLCRYMFWTDEDLREFIAREYSWFLGVFDSYRYPIQRVDAARYFLLYHYGGVYVDMDIYARRTFFIFNSSAANVVLPETTPMGLSNDFLITSKRRHPFFKRLINQLGAWNKIFVLPYLTVLVSTGPSFLTIQYHLASKQELDGVQILPNFWYGDSGHIIHHLVGSSWHGADAQLIFSERFRLKFFRSLKILAYCVPVFMLILLIRRKVQR